MVCRSVPGWHICETAQRYRNQSSHPDGKEQPPRFHPRVTKKVNEGFYSLCEMCISVPELLPKLDCSQRDTLVCVCTWFSAALGVCVLWSVKAEEISSSVW